MSESTSLTAPTGITMSETFRQAVEDIRLANQRLSRAGKGEFTLELAGGAAVVMTLVMTYVTALVYIPLVTASWIGMMWMGWATLLGGMVAGRCGLWLTSLRFYTRPNAQGIRDSLRAMSLQRARAIKEDSLTQVIELALAEIAQHTADTFEILGKYDAEEADRWRRERDEADARIHQLIKVIESALAAGGRLGSRMPLTDELQRQLADKVAEVGRRRAAAKSEAIAMLEAREETDEAARNAAELQRQLADKVAEVGRRRAAAKSEAILPCSKRARKPTKPQGTPQR